MAGAFYCLSQESIPWLLAEEKGEAEPGFHQKRPRPRQKSTARYMKPLSHFHSSQN